MRTIMTRRMVAVGAATAALLVAAVGGAVAAVTPSAVKAQPNPIREYGPAVSADFFAWSQTSKLRPHTYNLYEQAMSSGTPSGTATRVNVSGSQGFPGGISNTRLAYQQVINGQSDIRFYNLALHQHSNPPTGVNSSQWEYQPSITDTWLLFGRDGSGKSRVLLYNLSTHSIRVLFTKALNSHGTTYTVPGQVNGDYATFAVSTGLGTGDIYLYQISTRTLTKVPHPVGKQDFAPSVSSTGTLYFDRSGATCSSANQLTELPLGGSPTVLWTLATGGIMEASQTYNDGTNDQVFYSRFVCSTTAEDIFRIPGA